MQCIVGRVEKSKNGFGWNGYCFFNVFWYVENGGNFVFFDRWIFTWKFGWLHYRAKKKLSYTLYMGIKTYQEKNIKPMEKKLAQSSEEKNPKNYPKIPYFRKVTFRVVFFIFLFTGKSEKKLLSLHTPYSDPKCTRVKRP